MRLPLVAAGLLAWAGCGSPRSGLHEVDASETGHPIDAAIDGSQSIGDAATSARDGGETDASTGGDTDASTGGDTDASPMADAGGLDASVIDAGNPDATVTIDASVPDASSGGIVSGGPCISGAQGATAFRMRWSGSGGVAYPAYEAIGLPDTSGLKIGAYGYQIGFTPSFVDPFLGVGGLSLNGSSFVDIELSTLGISQIDSATLSIYGRSFNTTTSGSFNWQTFSGFGSSPANFVSNVAPYQWYSADMTSEIDPGDDSVLIRIKAGPASGSLVVHRIEICLDAS